MVQILLLRKARWFVRPGPGALLGRFLLPLTAGDAAERRIPTGITESKP